MAATITISKLKEQRKIVLTNLVIDIITVLPVVTVAILANSLALLTDLFDYSLTITSGTISILILRRCIKNERGNYDFGYGKLESLAALVTSIFMLIGLTYVLYEAFARVVETVELNSTFVIVGLIFQMIGFIINLLLWLKAYKLNKNAPSPILEAQWRVNRTNCIGNVTVAVSLALGIVFQDYAWKNYFDPIFAIILVSITAGSFIKLIKEVLFDLLDRSINENEQMKIIMRLAEFESCYERLYGITTRKSGRVTFISITLGFEPALGLGKVLSITNRIKDTLESDIANSRVNIIINSFEEYEEIIVKDESGGKILPMTEVHFKQSMEIAKSAFRFDDLERIKLEFLSSIYPNKFRKELNELKISTPMFWVAVIEKRVIGFCGYYFPQDEKDVVWGSWLAFESDSSRALIKFRYNFLWKCAFELRKTGKRYMKLMTSNLPSEQNAKKLYDNLGFPTFSEDYVDDSRVDYRIAEIAPAYNKSKLGKKKNKKTEREFT